ncbi:GTP-binding protein [Streptomyces sp. NEAU-PBA10]|uniref:ATP/GTP-binding protein n=1 Tax=Streptomyces tremellae TaxID=1124239 RepID=A0ABP7E044_9ACTN
MSGYVPSEAAPSRLRKLKIVVSGGFGTGKTTMVGAISEVRPLFTEAPMTQASEGIDRLDGVECKTTTTVAMDFGRVTLAGPGAEPDIVLMLFGTPGQDRFNSIWDDLSYRAAGAVVLVDTRRLEDAFAVVDYFEGKHLPFLVAVNLFDTAPRYLLDEVRQALRLGAHVPVLACDARKRESVRDVLSDLLVHALSHLPASAHAALGARP